MKKSAISIPILFCLLLIGGLSTAPAQTFDISSGGTPTITGNVSGSVVGSSSNTTNLNVVIDFGEVGPSNTNPVVKVVVPIAVRSLAPYRVTATVTGGNNSNPQAIQRSDVGFGLDNLRRMGFLSRTCNNSDHIFYSPFDNDPSSNVSYNAFGRATYPGDLGDIGSSTTILSGPTLSFLTAGRLSINGYIFDAIFTMTPQFYASGTTTTVITFSIASGPNVPC